MIWFVGFISLAVLILVGVTLPLLHSRVLSRL